MARHRSPSGHGPTTPLDAPAPTRARATGSHRIPRPGPAARGRFVVAAVAVGAVAAASQGLGQTAEPRDSTDGTTPLAFGGNAAVGLGGTGPAPGMLPLPAVVPVSPDIFAQDVSSLAKGTQIAEDRAQAELDAAEAAEAAMRAAEQAAAEAAAEAGADQLPVAPGEVVMPTSGTFTSGFGARWGTNHNGIDIANSIGTPIYATTDGVVVESGPASGFGMWIQLEHSDGTISVYGHINESLVEEGQEVAAGEQIATMGNRGQSTGPHLHFEIWLDGERKVDPLRWLRNNGVDV